MAYYFNNLFQGRFRAPLPPPFLGPGRARGGRARLSSAVREKSEPVLSGGQKSVITLVAVAGSLFLLSLITPDLWPEPSRRVQGYVVAKTWTRRYLGPKRRMQPATFRVSIANGESLRTLPVDSLRWTGLRLGQPASYQFQPRRFWE